MGDDDLEFGKEKSRSARQGRRAAPPPMPAADVDQDEIDTPVKSEQDGGVLTERPNKAVSGWGEEAPRKSRARQLGEGLERLEEVIPIHSQKQTKGAWDPVGDIDQELDEFERLRPRSPPKDEDSDSDIPVIPELEEQAEEDLTTKIATAPNVAVNRVATYRELDSDLLRQAAFQVLDNEIDLKLLTKGLSPMEDLIEEDRPWDWDQLFTEVSSELTTDLEKSAEEGESEDAES